MRSSRVKVELPLPFEEVLRRHERELMRFVMRATGNRDDALELFQETWLRAYRAYPRLESRDGIRPWLYRIATNLCRNYVRGNSRRARVFVTQAAEAEQSSDGGGHSAAGFERSNDLETLRKLIARLPDKQRNTLMMRAFGGVEYSEIAQTLGGSAESARANFSQALKKLKAWW